MLSLIHILILLAVAAVVTLVSMSLFMKMINNATNQEVPFGKFQEMVESGKVEEVTWDDETIYIKPKAEKPDTLFNAAPQVSYYTCLLYTSIIDLWFC